MILIEVVTYCSNNCVTAIDGHAFVDNVLYKYLINKKGGGNGISKRLMALYERA